MVKPFKFIKENEPMKNSSLVAIDIAKTIFQLIAVETTGKIVFSKKLTRTELLPFIAQLPSTLIAMEACGGAHYWARQFIRLGHQVKLISAKYVKPC
jgi:transposase